MDTESCCCRPSFGLKGMLKKFYIAYMKCPGMVRHPLYCRNELRTFFVLFCYFFVLF